MVVQKRRKIGRAIAMARFPFWHRIGRPETKRRPERRAAEEESVKDSREFDRDAEFCWSYWGESWRDIGWAMRFSIPEHIAKVIGHYSKERPFKVLDLGCGPGSALAALKRVFGERIKTAGLVLEKTLGEEYGGLTG